MEKIGCVLDLAEVRNSGKVDLGQNKDPRNLTPGS